MMVKFNVKSETLNFAAHDFSDTDTGFVHFSVMDAETSVCLLFVVIFVGISCDADINVGFSTVADVNGAHAGVVLSYKHLRYVTSMQCHTYV